MDIFQAFLSRDNENPPTFSEIFHSTAALKRALGTKSYLLEHYLSLFFRLTAQIDFVALQDEVHQAMGDVQRSFKENPSLLSEFPCQEPATKINLCFLQQADSILEQARKDFLREKTSEWNAAVDLMELRQAEQKLMERIGKEPLEAFQRMLFRRFLPCPLAPLFSQGILVELTKRIPLAGFGSGSGGLSAVSENFWARKKRLIYQSLFHFFSQKNSKSHHITTHRILESEIIA